MLAGTLGGLLATWVTFTPCFLWIFVGAPYKAYETGRDDDQRKGRAEEEDAAFPAVRTTRVAREVSVRA